MPRNLTAADRASLIRLASKMPKGSPERRAILSGLEKTARADRRFLNKLRDFYAVKEVDYDAPWAGWNTFFKVPGHPRAKHMTYSVGTNKVVDRVMIQGDPVYGGDIVMQFRASGPESLALQFADWLEEGASLRSPLIIGLDES